MTSWTAIRTLIIGATFFAPFTAAQAVTVDFTGRDWNGVDGSVNSDGIAVSDSTGVRLTSDIQGSVMTFNSSDGASGCGNSNKLGLDGSPFDLACIGDGIGIDNSPGNLNDDEITQETNDSLTVSFTKGLVNIEAIHLLDLFAKEQTGEKAVITWATGTYTAHATGEANPGGYWEVKLPDALTMAAIGSFTLTGFQDDDFSDYALARIKYSVVPVPAAFWMFGTALIGFVAMSRRTKV